MSKIAVLDWSYITYHVWQSLPTRRIPWTRPTEAEEGIHRICAWVYALQCEHKWDRLIIAKDSAPYWRKAYMQEWYEATPLFEVEGEVYCLHHGAWHKVVAEESFSRLEKLSGDAEKALLKKDRVPCTLHEEYPPIAWPTYKGNRKKEETWACETPLETYYTIRDRLADRLCALVGAKVIAFAGAEADDVAAVCASFTQHSIVLMTGDGDWQQLLRAGHHVHMHNLYSNTRISSSPENTAVLAKWLAVKIIGGDGGDNIKGIPRVDRKGRSCLAEAGAVKLLDTTERKAIPGLLCPRSIEKNRRLMALDRHNICPNIWAGIEAELQAPPKAFSGEPWTWEQLGLTGKERERIEVAGGAARIFGQWASDPAKTAEALA